MIDETYVSNRSDWKMSGKLSSFIGSRNFTHINEFKSGDNSLIFQSVHCGYNISQRRDLE